MHETAKAGLIRTVIVVGVAFMVLAEAANAQTPPPEQPPSNRPGSLVDGAVPPARPAETPDPKLTPSLRAGSNIDQILGTTGKGFWTVPLGSGASVLTDRYARPMSERFALEVSCGGAVALTPHLNTAHSQGTLPGDVRVTAILLALAFR